MTDPTSEEQQRPTFRVTNEMLASHDTYFGEVTMFVAAIAIQREAPTEANAAEIARIAANHSEISKESVGFWKQVAEYLERQGRGESPEEDPVRAWVFMHWTWIATDRPTGQKVLDRMREDPNRNFALPKLRTIQGILKDANVPSGNKGGRPKKKTAQN